MSMLNLMVKSIYPSFRTDLTILVGWELVLKLKSNKYQQLLILLVYGLLSLNININAR